MFWKNIPEPILARKKEIFLAAAILATLGVIAFFSKKAYDRIHSLENSPKDSVSRDQNRGESSDEDKRVDEASDSPGEFLAPEDKSEDDHEEKELQEDEKTPTVKENFIDISQKDCREKCEKYQKNKGDYQYCRQVCGLSEVKKRSSEEECDDLEDLELDYCLRDLGISQKDYSICEKIEDAAVFKMCRDRITEELINGSRAE